LKAIALLYEISNWSLGKFFNLDSINKIRTSDPRLLREVGDLTDIEGDSEALLQAVRLVK
jgi:hypothetical protein